MGKLGNRLVTVCCAAQLIVAGCKKEQTQGAGSAAPAQAVPCTPAPTTASTPPPTPTPEPGAPRAQLPTLAIPALVPGDAVIVVAATPLRPQLENVLRMVGFDDATLSQAWTEIAAMVQSRYGVDVSGASGIVAFARPGNQGGIVLHGIKGTPNRLPPDAVAEQIGDDLVIAPSDSMAAIKAAQATPAESFAQKQPALAKAFDAQAANAFLVAVGNVAELAKTNDGEKFRRFGIETAVLGVRTTGVHLELDGEPAGLDQVRAMVEGALAQFHGMLAQQKSQMLGNADAPGGEVAGVILASAWFEMMAKQLVIARKDRALTADLPFPSGAAPMMAPMVVVGMLATFGMRKKHDEAAMPMPETAKTAEPVTAQPITPTAPH